MGGKLTRTIVREQNGMSQQSLNRIWYLFEELAKTSNVSDDLPKAMKGNWNLMVSIFKRCTSKQNTQPEARQKDMLDKRGVETAENLDQKQRHLQKGDNRSFFIRLAWRYAT